MQVTGFTGGLSCQSFLLSGLNPSLRLSGLGTQLGPSVVAFNMKSLGRACSHATDCSFFLFQHHPALGENPVKWNTNQCGSIRTSAGDTMRSVTLPTGMVHLDHSELGHRHCPRNKLMLGVADLDLSDTDQLRPEFLEWL